MSSSGSSASNSRGLKSQSLSLAGFEVGPEERQEAHELIQALQEKYNEKNGSSAKRRIKRADFDTEISKITLSSWRINEQDYRKGLVPTMARGLFTRTAEDGKYEIVIRGYDKFFNIDEVDKTKWDNICEDTTGPYEVTLKKNGCIIFISGLPNGEIVVASKHSTGSRTDIPVSHAQKGEEWLEKHLEEVSMLKQDLAAFLYDHKYTAVAELCDDSFEEHVLPYPEEQRGLHLHGINYNTAKLKTLPTEEVAEFAKKWGFLQTKYLVKETAEEVRKFTDEIKQTGSLDGILIEGLVIRCKKKETYEDFFFKVKYEPYLMYREWREITKAVLAGKKPRLTYPRSESYVGWVRKKIRSDPELFEKYNNGIGVVLVRDLFLEHEEEST